MIEILLDIRVWAAVVVGAALMAVGWQAKSWTVEPPRKPPADTIIKKEQITKRDTVTQTRTETVIRYKTVREVDTVRIAVPTDMRIQGVIPPTPLDLSADEATLTYFDPSAQRWTQNVYSIPEESWHLWPSIEAMAAPTFLQAGIWANVRWKRVTLSAGYVQAGSERRVGVRVAVRPFVVSF